MAKSEPINSNGKETVKTLQAQNYELRHALEACTIALRSYERGHPDGDLAHDVATQAEAALAKVS